MLPLVPFGDIAGDMAFDIHQHTHSGAVDEALSMTTDNLLVNEIYERLFLDPDPDSDSDSDAICSKVTCACGIISLWDCVTSRCGHVTS